MTSPELENLADLGHLKRESPARDELEGLVSSAASRLEDSRNEELSLDSRFDLAYNAAHALAHAALRWHGYRAEKRYFVFAALAHTVGLPAAKWRVLAKCHDERNRVEYEGLFRADETLVESLIEIAAELLERLSELPPPE